MDIIPNLEVQQIPDGHDCGDCIWYMGCKRMDEINGTNYCTCLSQRECPKRNYVLSSDWEQRRVIRRENNRKHQMMMKKRKKNKKKRR